MSQINKLGYVDAKLGAPSSGQQTTRVLFNTIENPGTTNQVTFFRNFQGLTSGQTNLTTNKLDSMESMVIKTITFMQWNTSGVLNNFFGGSGFISGVASIIVGNQTVVKNIPLQFNMGYTGQAFDRLHENGGSINQDLPGGVSATAQKHMPCEIRLLTDIVIPPQVTFEVRVDTTNGQFGDAAITCALAGYGKIFSAGNSF